MTHTARRQTFRLCVFLGAQTGNRPEYVRAAEALGRGLAQRGWGLVYGGGGIGLMGVLADAVLEEGAEVIGVIPRSLEQRELAHSGASQLIVVETMHERKQAMFDHADAVVALPGGYGTLDELCELLTWAQLGYHEKPCALLNVAGYFDPLLAFFDRALADGMLGAHNRELIRVHEHVDALLDDLGCARVRTRHAAGEAR